MLTLDDCRDFCGLNECQIHAIEYCAGLSRVEVLALAQQADHDCSACLRILQCLHEFSERVCRCQHSPYSETEMRSSIYQYVNNHQQVLSQILR